jgi:hypothetical protein
LPFLIFFGVSDLSPSGGYLVSQIPLPINRDQKELIGAAKIRAYNRQAKHLEKFFLINLKLRMN